MQYKKGLFLLLCAVLILAVFPAVALAADDNDDGYDDNDFTKLQIFLNLPSAEAGESNGKQINDAYDANDPGTWTGVSWDAQTPKRVASIGEFGEWTYKSLAGSLDLSGFSALENLIIYSNSIQSLDLTGAVSLNSVYADENALTSLTIDEADSLTELYCQFNQLGALNLSDAPQLRTVRCYSNQLTSLVLGTNTNLQSLECDGNLLTSLNVSGNTGLTELYCSDNQLTELIVSANTALTTLNCSENQLTGLDISANTALERLYCDDNILTALDLSHNAALSVLECGNNHLSELAADQSALETLSCQNNHLKRIHATFIDDMDFTLTASGSGYVQLSVESDKEGWMIDAAAVPQSGGTFMFWAASGAVYSTETDLSLDAGSYTLTAVFSPLTVTFDSRSGSAVSAQPVDYGEKASEPLDPSRPNYSFGGWYKDEAFTLPWHFDADTVTQDSTLYAKWTAQPVLTSSSVGGKVYTGGRITLAPNIVGGTWSFDNAFLTRDGNTFTAIKTGTTTVTYTAEGQSVYYTVTIGKAQLPSTGQSFVWVIMLSGIALTILFVAAVAGKRKARV